MTYLYEPVILSDHRELSLRRRYHREEQQTELDLRE